MRITALFTALVLCFLAVIPVSATEIPPEETKPRYLCDADGDGYVTAGDARLILRAAVGLDKIALEDIIYCDADETGDVEAADARIALRTAVALEKSVKCAFVIKESSEASCSKEGHILAECALTGRTAEINTSKLPHSLPADAGCKGEGVCSTCTEKIILDIKHEFKINSCKGEKNCINCGLSESFEPYHEFKTNPCEGEKNCGNCGFVEKFEPYHVFETDLCKGEKVCKHCSYTESVPVEHDFYGNANCARCGLASLGREFSDFIADYLVKNGGFEDGIYYFEDHTEYLGRIFMYDTTAEYYEVCLWTCYAMEVNGTVYTFEFYYFPEKRDIEMYAFMGEEPTAYCIANVKVDKISSVPTGDGLFVIEDAVASWLPLDVGYFRTLVEQVAYENLLYLKDFATKNSFSHAKELYTENPEFR